MTTFLDIRGLLLTDRNLPDETDSVCESNHGSQLSDGALQTPFAECRKHLDKKEPADYKSQKSCPYPKPTKLAIVKQNATSDDSKVFLFTPTLTNVSVKSQMAIIKIDKYAVSQLRRLAKNKGDSDSDHGRDTNVPVKFTMAATEPFVIALDHVTKIKVIFKLLLDGCLHEEREKFVSVFVELSDPEGNHLKTPFLMTLFLKNLKDENGNSFKKCIKLNPSSSSRVERGIRDFVAVKDFDNLLNKEQTACFGLFIKH